MLLKMQKNCKDITDKDYKELRVFQISNRMSLFAILDTVYKLLKNMLWHIRLFTVTLYACYMYIPQTVSFPRVQ